MADRVMTDRAMADHRLSQISTASSTNSKRAKAHIGPWQLGRTLGSGSSGRVRLAKHIETGKLAAVKIVPKAQTGEQSNASKTSESYGIEREVIIMKLIEHPNIMALYDVWENKGELYLVLEYIEGGELFDYLISRGRLSEREAVHYFRQICFGVDYCHKFNICHRDLKPENLLLDKNRNIKIADFGMAALEANGRLLETSCGSPHYASPEIVTGKTYHGAPSDIWSCGIILFALLTGHLPFDDDNIRQLLLKVQAGKFSMPPSLSLEARDLISRMLVVDPMERICMQEIFDHPLLRKYPPRHVPAENTEKKQPKVDVRQPIANIDHEILRNLQTLWHYGSMESLVVKLKQSAPNTEKTFYSLLLRFRQRHGLANRESLPRNRSVASVRSIRSSKSVRSIASLNTKPGSMKSLKSIRSNRSSRSIKSSRRIARKSPIKQLEINSNHANRRGTSSVVKDHQNTDMFAQILDQAFNTSKTSVDSRTGNSSRNSAEAQASKVSAPYSGVSNASNNTMRKRQSPGLAAQSTKKTTTPVSKHAGYSAAPITSGAPAQQGLSSKRDTFDFDFSDHSLSTGPQAEHNYLLPMIFEEDRFADAIEEEMELKVYKRNQKSQKDAESKELQNRSFDASQLRITNLVAGESFLSYQPSPAAAAIAAPVRQAPRAPSGPRAMPTGRKPVPIYVESDLETTNETIKSAASTDNYKERVPLGELTEDDLKHQRDPNVSKGGLRSGKSKTSTDSETLRIAKRGEKPENDTVDLSNAKSKPKLSWIRRLTPRIVSRKLSKSELPDDRETSNARSEQPNRVSTSSKRASTTKETLEPRAVEKTRSQNASANKENLFPHNAVTPKSTTYAAQEQQRRASRNSTASVDEPGQSWLMKILTSSTSSSSRTLMSTCQPIELRAIILEIISEWLPHGLALYNDGPRGEPIVVALLSKNSLGLKSARIGIQIKPFNNTSSTTKLSHQKGSRSSFVAFANEMERRLGDNNVLSFEY